MATIHVDAQTAGELSSLAAASGMTVEAYLKAAFPSTVQQRLSWEEFERLVKENSFDGPSLPLDFSRADIYDGHD